MECVWAALIVVIVDICPMPVRRPRADGGVFIIVMLTALVMGSGVVHPVLQVSLQPLVRKQSNRMAYKGELIADKTSN